MSHDFYADAANKSKRRNRMWYQENILTVLAAAKEKRAREIDAAIELAEKLLGALDEPLPKPTEIVPRSVEHYTDASLMKPVDPKVVDILYESAEKGAAETYLKIRNKKSPEDKYYFRAKTSWDYGWGQNHSRLPAKDVNNGRCAILRDTFYRKSNLGPDPTHYMEPMTGEGTGCSKF